MWKLILFVASLMVFYAGCNKVMTKSTPVICSVEDAEKKDLSNYDYFQLSKGYVSGIGYYEYTEGSSQVNEFVYGLISEKLIDEYLEKYQQTHDDLDSFAAWFSTHAKPKIFIRSSRKHISKSEFDNFLSNTEKELSVDGTRVKSFMDLSENIKDEMANDGITESNSILIEEGKAPSDNKGEGWAMIVGGIILFFVSIAMFLKK